MKTGERPGVVAGALPAMLAALWPLGVYTQIPLTPVLLSHVAVIALGVAALARHRANRKHRPPFEYWWPAAAGLIALAVSPAGAGVGFAGGILYAVFFLGALVLVQGRGAAAQACLVLACSGAAAAVLNGAAQAGIRAPSAIDIAFGIATIGPGDLRQGALLLFHACLAGIFASLHPQLPFRARCAAATASVIAAIWLALAILPEALALATPQASWTHLATSPAHGTAALMALWLVARVAARGWLRPPGAGMPARGLAPALTLTGAAACILWGAPPDPAALLLLGILAAHDNPWATGEDARAPRLLVGVACACVAIQVLAVLPLAPSDPRNQAARAARLLEAGAWPEMEGTLDFMLARHPGHPAYSLLHARALAAQGWPEAAAAAYRATEYPEDGDGSHGINFATHRRALLDSLRDQASRLPLGERGIFFEQALVHSGDPDNALRFLALQEATPGADVDVPPAAAARALALLLGDPALATRLESESPGTLLVYLAGGGIQVAPLPGGAAPVLLYAVAGPDGVSLALWPTLESDQPETHTLPFAAPGGAGAVSLRWSPPVPSGDGMWEVRLQLPPHTLATLSLDASGGIVVHPAARIPAPEGGSAAAALFIP